ncbi:MAG: succinate dehydrogenase, cytochrome b556 subunit [Pseudomonadota bacterium]
MSKTDHTDRRPLSPHLQVYRLPYNAIMSISGRAVGIGLSGAMVLLCLCFAISAWFPPFYDFILGLSDFFLIPYALAAASFFIFFYLGNGIRHVIWHLKIGVNEGSGILTGNIVLLVSLILSIGLGYLILEGNFNG